MLESVSVVEVVLSALVLALAVDNIGLRFKIKNVQEAVGLIGASIKHAVAEEFETVHGRIDRLFDKGSEVELQVAALAAEAKSDVSGVLGTKEYANNKAAIAQPVTLAVTTVSENNGTNVPQTNS